jgi:uncharacterized protein
MRLILLALTGWLIAAGSWAFEPEEPTGYVNDRANLLSSGVRSQLEQQLRKFDQQESTQIAVLIVPSLEGDTIEQAAVRIFEQWGIGTSEADNGALLLIAVADRKLRIEVGYGLEGRLTDLTAGRIIRDQISPHFRNNDFDQGVTSGIYSIMAAVTGEYQATEQPQQDSIVPLILFVIMFFLIPYLSRRSRRYSGRHDLPISYRSSSRRRPGGFGGGGFSSGGGFGGFGGGGSGGGGASGGW